jgi:DNA replication protein DnaC
MLSSVLPENSQTSSVVKTCRGVPPYVPGVYARRDEWPAISCETVIPPLVTDDPSLPGSIRANVCDSCAAELQRRSDATLAEQDEESLRLRIERAGWPVALPKPFVTGAKSLASWRPLSSEHPRALAACRELIAALGDRWSDVSLNAMIVGGPGTGKSHLLCGVVREVIRSGKRALFVNCRDLAVALQCSFRDGAKVSADEIITRLSSPVLLALDDIGATKATRLVADSFYSILERRAQNELPTIVSSNYTTMRELAERLLPPDGDELDAIRPVDRLRELCPRTFHLKGESQRAKVNR